MLNNNAVINVVRGGIYWCDLGNDKLRGEQMHVRPVLCISNNLANKYSPTITVACITSKINKADRVPTHVLIDSSCGLKTDSIVLLEQIITVSKERLGNYIGRVSDELTLKRIENKIKVSLGTVKYIDKLKDNVREEIQRQLDDIYSYESVISKTNNTIIINELLKEREQLLNKLQEYCDSIDEDYKNFYQDYKTRIC